MSERLRTEESHSEPKTEAAEKYPRPPIVDRLLARRERHRRRSKLFRVAWVVAAALIMIFGLLITPLPGPGPLIVIPAGLAMLALEFEWAERLLEWMLIQGSRVTRGLSTWAKIAVAVLALAAITAVFAATYYWDVPILPDK